MKCQYLHTPGKRCRKCGKTMQIDVTKNWKRNPVDRHKFTSRNGDKLDDLNRLAGDAISKLIAAQQELRIAEERLRPLRESVTHFDFIHTEACTRLNKWWSEYEGRS